MIVEKTKLDSTIEHLKDYLNTRYDLAVLKVSDKSSTILSAVIAYVLLAVIGIFFLIFVSFGAALMISEAIGNSYSGFMIVAGFYLLVAIILFAIRDKFLKMPLMNMFVKKLCMEDNCDA